MPSRGEWENDCRPGVLRVETWLREHPGTDRYSPFTVVSRSIRRFCEDWLEHHAERLERRKSTRPIPETLRAILAGLNCAEDKWHAWEDAIDGSFVEGSGHQWVIVCSRPDHWRLLVIPEDSPSGAIELARMAGYDWIWEVAVAPPEYFDWVSSDEIGVDDQWSVPPPERDIVVVEFLADMKNPGKFAFYETKTGWVQAGVRCCRWPQ